MPTVSKEPEIAERRAQSEDSSAALLNQDNSKHDQSLGKRAKHIWHKMKEEDRERKESKMQHISHEEATKITGYGEGGAKSHNSDGKGDKRTAGLLFFG